MALASNPNRILSTGPDGRLTWLSVIPLERLDGSVLDDIEAVDVLPPTGLPTKVYYRTSDQSYWRWISNTFVMLPGDVSAAINGAVTAHATSAHPYTNQPNTWGNYQTFNAGIAVAGGNINASTVDQTIGVLTASQSVRTNVLSDVSGNQRLNLAGSSVALTAPLTMGTYPLTANGGIQMANTALSGASLVETPFVRAASAAAGLAFTPSVITAGLPLVTQSVAVSGDITGVTTIAAGTGQFSAVTSGTVNASSLTAPAVSATTAALVNADLTWIRSPAGVPKLRFDGTDIDANADLYMNGNILFMQSAAINGASTIDATTVAATSVSTSYLNSASGAARIRLDGADINLSRPLYTDGNAIYTQNGAIDMGNGVLSALGVVTGGDAIIGRAVTSTIARPGGTNVVTLQPSVSQNGGTQEMYIDGRLRFATSGDDTHAVYRYQPWNELHLVGGGAPRQVRIYDTLDVSSSIGAPIIRTDTVRNTAGQARLRFDGPWIDADAGLHMNGNILYGVGEVGGTDGFTAFDLTTAGQVRCYRNFDVQSYDISGATNVTAGTVRAVELTRQDGSARMSFGGAAIDVRTEMYMGGNAIRQVNEVYSTDGSLAFSTGGSSLSMGRPLNMAGNAITNPSMIDGIDPKSIPFSVVQTFTTVAGLSTYTYNVPGGLNWRIMNALWLNNNNGHEDAVAVTTDTWTSIQLDRPAGFTITLKLMIDRNGP